MVESVQQSVSNHQTVLQEHTAENQCYMGQAYTECQVEMIYHH